MSDQPMKAGPSATRLGEQKGRKQMGKIREEILSGFCRQQNQGRTVTCELEESEKGIRLSFVDCGYADCAHKGSCLIAGEIRKLMVEEGYEQVQRTQSEKAQ